MKKMRHMVSMEFSDDEKLDAIMPIPMPKGPEFPCGLRCCLTEAEFQKLDLDPSEAEVGGMFHGHFMARITSVSSSEGESGKCCRVEFQIEDLEIESEDAENEEG